jgi:hypothetical protein
MAGTTCRLDVSDFSLELVPSSGRQSEEWNVYSVLVQRDGLNDTRQQSRWQNLSTSVKQRRGSADELVGGAAPIDALLAKLSWAPCNQASLLVDFKHASQQGSPVGGKSLTDAFVNSDVSGASFRKVAPKTNHQIAVSVIARRRVEVGAAVVSPGVSSGDGSPSSFQVLRTLRSIGSSPLASPSSSFDSPMVDDGRFGHFVCHITVDPAEVYNSPSGQLEYRFQLRHQDVTRDSLYSHLAGTPRYLSFTVTAHREDAKPTRILRNFHDTCVLLDQFVLDATASGGKPGRGSLEYGFGFFPDTTLGVDKKRLTHYTRDFRRPVLAEDGESLILNFAHPIDAEKVTRRSPSPGRSQSPQREEPVSPKDPNDSIIISSDCTAFNEGMIGKRMVGTARFKTDEVGGLCKTSLKSTLALALLWRDPQQPLQDTTMDVSQDRIDLAKDVMNQEDFPADGVIRSVAFSYGERLYFRIRKRCFEAPRHYGTPLLSPPAVTQLCLSEDTPTFDCTSLSVAKESRIGDTADLVDTTSGQQDSGSAADGSLVGSSGAANSGEVTSGDPPPVTLQRDSDDAPTELDSTS